MTEHVHHWIVSPPEGPTSRGRCRTCRKTATFANSLDAGVFNGGYAHVKVCAACRVSRSLQQFATVPGDPTRRVAQCRLCVRRASEKRRHELYTDGPVS
jgi:hypothetical protein